MGKFFNPDNFLWRGFGRVADFMLLSCCFFLCSIPLVTIPAAAIALYDATARCVYGKEEHPYRRFFKTFKSELGRSVALAVLWALIAFLLGGAYQILGQAAQTNESLRIFAALLYFSLFIPVAWFCWVLMVESRFVYPFGALHKMGLYFTFRHLPTTVIVAGLGLVSYWICVNMPFFLMILPGVCAYLQSIFVERVFAKYVPKTEE